MTQDTLTPYPGVLKRPKSNLYQFGLRVPKDLLQHFKSSWAIRCSLGTADLRTANNKAKVLQAEWAAKFEALRSGQPIPVPAVPAAPSLDLGALRTKMLRHAEQRYLPKVDRRIADMTPEARTKEAQLIATNRDIVLEGLRHELSPDVLHVAQSWLDAMVGKNPAPAAVTEALAFFAMLQDLHLEALTDETRTFQRRAEALSARRTLAAIDAPMRAPEPAMAQQTALLPVAKASGRTMADALKAWADAAPRSSKTTQSFTRHVAQFTAMMGNPDLASIKRVDALAFRDKLQAWALAEGKTAVTAENAIVCVRALTNVARDRGWIEHNPFERLSVAVGGKKSSIREPWTQEELKVLFDDPIWTAYALPKDRKAGGAAAYWIPLIACYTGARVSEIAQLWTDDLTLTPGGEVIEFREKDERGQKLKTDGSWRAVPMHSELVRLGLATYAASLPVGPLFPAVPQEGENGPGGQFSQWFSAFKRAKGFRSIEKTMHSFRHLVASELRLAGAPEALADAITGHAGSDSIARRVYSATIRREAARLRPVIELLRFEALAHLSLVAV